MITLRPHHLLCTQGYSGNGYSNEFVSNMNRIVTELRKKDTMVEVIFSSDDICVECPNNVEESKCSSNEKVMYIDSKVIEHFNIEEKIYNYGEIVRFIKDNITEEIMNDICSRCEWYPISNCKRKICLREEVRVSGESV
ncbi:MAG: DUF1284 domain-containing protein [Clostridium sp.]